MKKYNWRLNIDEIKKLYLKGYSCEQIGKILGATRQAIWEKMKNAKIKTRKKKVLPYIIYDEMKFTASEYGYYRATGRKRHIALHRYIWEKEIGKIPEDHDIHHKDGDGQNNDIKNLECLLKSEHTRKYSPHHNQYKNNKTLCKK